MLTSLLISVALFVIGPSQEAGRTEPPPGAESISVWEGMSQADPNNLDLRVKLLEYYSSHGTVEKYFQQALWIVQHHPESPATGIRLNPALVKAGLSETDYALLKSAWEQAIIDQADSGKVLSNAGFFFMTRDPVRAVHFLEQARQLETENPSILRMETYLYVTAFDAIPMDSSNPLDVWKPEDQQTLRGEIASANDPALLAEVGLRLIRFGNSNAKTEGTELINRAIRLDPTNEKWKAALRTPSLPPPPATEPLGPVRVGPQVAKANLIHKVDPAYPSLAISARISGTVEFTATVGEDGHVQNVQLFRGHPLLVNAAKKAVLQYVYGPIMLNGNPVAFVTSIIVPFELPSQQ